VCGKGKPTDIWAGYRAEFCIEGGEISPAPAAESAGLIAEKKYGKEGLEGDHGFIFPAFVDLSKDRLISAAGAP
jgi:hypothetical protein